MLLNGGVLDGVRILGRKTVEQMTLDHLPPEVARQHPVGPGRGFGYGFWVVTDPARAVMAPSPGAYGWAGGANTYFFIDPAEQLFAILMTQLRPFRRLPLAIDLSTLVYQSLVD
jgi:CubicO group peptidase (beta-lactamase class C family)